MQTAKIIHILLKLGLISLLVIYSVPATADESIEESELSLVEHLAIDKEMDTLHGPRRFRISYRDYNALQEEPDLPPIWPLYKQQPAIAQGDFRNPHTDLWAFFTQTPPVSSLPQPSTPTNNSTPNNPLPLPQDPQYEEDSGAGPYEVVPEPSSPSPPSTPTVQSPSGTVPTLPSTLPPWVIFPPPSEGGGVVL